MKIPGRNEPDPSDIIKSTTLNLTKATTAGSAVLGVFTIFGAPVADFTKGQQTTLFVALLATVAN